MSAPPVFRSLGTRVRRFEALVTPPASANEILYIHQHKTYGLTPDLKATYNNPIKEQLIKVQEKPVVKQMKVQLLESLETLTLSPTSTRSPITRMPVLPSIGSVPSITTPTREVLRIPTSGTRIFEVPEQEIQLMVPSVGRRAPTTALSRPSSLNIDPAKISKGRGRGQGIYTAETLRQKLRGLGLSATGNKSALVDRLVAYIRDNEPALYGQLSTDVKL